VEKEQGLCETVVRPGKRRKAIHPEETENRPNNRGSEKQTRNALKKQVFAKQRKKKPGGREGLGHV